MSRIKEFTLPDLGEGLTEGEIARWLVQEGQEVAEDDPLVEIQTDKTTVEIPSPAAGTVSKILAGEGDVVPVGTVIVVIGDRESGSEPQSPSGAQERPEQAAAVGAKPARGSEPQSSTRPGGAVRATPLVRRIAQELGVDLATVLFDLVGDLLALAQAAHARPLAGIDDLINPGNAWAAFDMGDEITDFSSELFQWEKTADIDHHYEETIAIWGNLSP